MDSSSRWPQIIANVALPQDQMIALPESGWGALIAWLAGPTWVHPDPAAVPPPVTVSVTSGGATTETWVDRTPGTRLRLTTTSPPTFVMPKCRHHPAQCGGHCDARPGWTRTPFGPGCTNRCKNSVPTHGFHVKPEPA